MSLYLKNCVVCSNLKQVDKDGVCQKCRHILNEEAPRVNLYNLGSLEQEVNDLERRIPGLFVGPTCPLDFYNGQGCDCNRSCKALKVKTNKNS